LEARMKQLNTPNPKLSKPDRITQRKLAILDPRFKQKEQNTKRFKIGQSVTAGHVRGGHSFH